MASISQEEAQDLIWTNGIVIQDISNHRWHIKQLVVFDYNDRAMGFYYLVPATEMQEDSERFESDPVEIFPVRAKQITTTWWEPIDE